jgi:hypothetical protein
MSTRNKLARILVILGCIILFAGAALHSVAAHLRAFPALSVSNLPAPLQAAFRTVFLLVGWHWVVIAVVALLAAFTETKLRKPLVLFCGLALLVDVALMLAFIGVFVGDEMLGSAALLIICGGLLL